ncbi:zinc finger imprinted 3-like [Palaemon carinicauda]|uniref:zinc finger imprinted 3-like n=1 Tax=Palaemon carinicauda TaxID=392227 RepID=UPI0035B5E0C7
MNVGLHKMADLTIIHEQRNPADVWLKGILTSRGGDDFNPEEVKNHLDSFAFEDDLAEKDLPNAMEFVSVECNMLFDSDFNMNNDTRLGERSVRKKKHKSKKNRYGKSSKKNAVFPLLYPLPLISELFRYRNVDVYKRSNKDGPFIKIFPSESINEKGNCDLEETTIIDDCDESVNVKRVKDMECDICGRQLLPQDLEAHLQQEHMEGIFFKCEVCKKKFTEKKYLIAHRILHVNVVGRPYPCSLCHERFTNKTALKNHSQSHHTFNKDVHSEFSNLALQTYDKEQTAGNKKEFQCQHCEKSFTYKVQCTSHEKLHSGNIIVKCDDCDDTFNVKQMVNHQRKHSKGKPYQCDKCGAAFRARSSLWSHKKSHFGHKPRECPDCGSMFWKSSALKKHKKTHHE